MGIVLWDGEQAYLERAMTKKPPQFQEAIAYHRAGRIAEAIRVCTRILHDTPNHFDCAYFLAMLYAQDGNIASAVKMFRRAVNLKPDFLDARYNLAVALSMSGEHDEAAKYYKDILDAEPRHLNARNNYAASLLKIGRSADALQQYDQLIARQPDLADAYNNRGMALQELKRFDEALVNYDKAIALKPNFPEALVNRGNTLMSLRRAEDALGNYKKAVSLAPDFAAAYNNIGNIYCALKSYDKALDAFDRALLLKADDSEAQSMRLYAKMHLCNWVDFDVDRSDVVTCACNGSPIYPFVFLAISSSPGDQLQCARTFSRTRYPQLNRQTPRTMDSDSARVRIAYVSSDFHEHATSYLMAGMFAHHDKSAFEVTAISTGLDDNSEMRRRLKDSFEHFVEACTLSDDEIASYVRDARVDILVDLKGFTEGARTGILAQRPAPIQVNYLGYPGTMGADYIDYIIADHTVIPDSQRAYYAEKIVYLPDSYQVNDSKRIISDKTFSRIEFGLPAEGFVFCCFNNNYKILPNIFDCWMRILKSVHGSVLWLLEDNAAAAANLKHEAQARGIAAERIVFARRMPLSDHLARHRLADLFLDTLPYNAHTTASDALWAGLPVLTQIGEAFAGRVAASLLNAIGLPELIAHTLEEYEKTAIALASDPDRLASIKRKLAQNRLASPLFDTQLFTRHIESAYRQMYEHHRAGLPPDHIFVSEGPER